MRLFGLAILLLIVSSPLKCYGGGAEDFQLWMFQTGSKPLSDKWSLQVEADERWEENASKLFFYYIHIGTQYRPCDAWSITPVFRHVWKKEMGEWVEENRALIDYRRYWSCGGIDFVVRNRFEYTFRDKDFYFRFRFQTYFPYKLGGRDFDPFVYNEVFFLNGANIVQNRFQVGFQTPFSNDCIRSTIAYMFRLKKSGVTWNGFNNLVTGIFFDF